MCTLHMAVFSMSRTSVVDDLVVFSSLRFQHRVKPLTQRLGLPAFDEVATLARRQSCQH